MDPDIDSDLKKARAFLVAFSTAVLLAWYFSADLRTINIIGFSLKIRDNAHNLWMVIAVINLHFLLRYVQKLPEEARLPDDAMQIAFERTLISHAASAYHRRMLNETVQRDFLSPGPKTKEIVKLHPRGEMQYRERFRSSEAERKRSLEQLRRIYGLKIIFTVPYEFKTEVGGEGASTGNRIEITPNRYAVALCYIVGFLRGIVFTPWMSEYILPVILGLASVLVAACSWWLVNY